MAAGGEDELICDFAEVYHVYDWRGLPLKLAATLAGGLSEDSRSKRRLNGTKASMNTLLLAKIADQLNMWNWSFSENGRLGIDPPQSLVKILTGEAEQPKPKIRTFQSFEEFQAELKKYERG